MARKSAPKAPPRKAKTSAAAKAKSKSTAGTSVVPIGVTIRMYCQGLGDCFLLTFHTNPKSKPSRVLIDCGVFLNTPGESHRLRAVADNLFKETNGKIDLLIVTHEHWDHISGFSHAQDIFEKFTFGAVWLSWAENPDDPDARAIKADLGKKRSQLKAAVGLARKKLAMAGAADAERLKQDMESSLGLLGFFGPLRSERTSLAAAKSDRMDLGETMNWLREKVKTKDFCRPGERREIPGAEGVHAFVLGPPRGASQLRKMNPTGDQGYKIAGAVPRSAQLSMFGAVEWAESSDATTAAIPPCPFEPRFRIGMDEAKDDPYFRRHYGFPDDPMADSVATWRRIDQDWLSGGLSRLALQLDIGVNNTSLALAFELPDGRTLIFPGDAQIGNWLSWGALKFQTVDKAGRSVEVSSKDLLNRAVFYKVGHHGSHNATLRVGGLEEMTSGELVAMIPTDQDFAHTRRPPKTGWEMPAHGIEQALRGFTGGRIIRADCKSIKELDQEIVAPEERESRTWKEFRNAVAFKEKFPPESEKQDTEPLYVEFTIT
jgi:hypothetical protein